MPETRRLQDLAGIGPALLSDLHLLGIATVARLAKKDGRKLYLELCRLTGTRQDPCVEDALVCAVAQARNPDLPAEQRQWWYWSRVRKQRQTAASPAKRSSKEMPPCPTSIPITPKPSRSRKKRSSPTAMSKRISPPSPMSRPKSAGSSAPTSVRTK
ncbi:MAG TPA: hypothetical protein DCY80_16690 [Solibacterales bacterium]|nr:hypothetical protein [Bryobacterales bacterium]